MSLVKLGHEQCELCTATECHKKQSDHPNGTVCDMCERYDIHIKQAETSRRAYREVGDRVKVGCVVYSVDLQKVIQLPRLEGLKTVVFAQRLICFNETFAPVGDYAKYFPVLPCVWDESTAGRSSDNITSTFSKFLTFFKDIPNVVLWLDNYSSQNKNWGLFLHLILYINSAETTTQRICLKYFETGHTFMAADSFHAAVEKQMKQSPPITFSDFIENCSNAKSKVQVQQMDIQDFFRTEFNVSQYTLNHIKPRPYIDNIRIIVLKKGTRQFLYSERVDANDEEMSSCDIMSKKTSQISFF